jgi:hypothetical protein
MALAAAIGLWWWGNNRYQAGVMNERSTWQSAAAELIAQKTAKVNTAATALATAAEKVAIATDREIIHVRTIYRNRPAVLCLSDDGVRELEASRASIRAAASAGGSALPTTAATADPSHE